MRNTAVSGLLCFVLIGVTTGCHNSSKNESIFNEVNSSHSQLLFSNNITESDSLHYHDFPYIYLGGGIGLGDMNNDGLLDIYVTGNMVENKLYLNRGNMVFEDVSVAAGVQGSVNKWYTGIAMVDINHDGWLDIYLSVSGKNTNTANELYINNGNLTFTEAAAEYGIDDTSASMQSTFFDYDKDGDMDLIAGNLGLNYKYTATPEKPFEVFLNDFDQNGRNDIVLGVNKKGRLLPLRGWECSSQQVPALKVRYETYREFASADLYDLYGEIMLQNSVHYKATTFAHYWLENTGEGKFIWHILPNRSQFSPVNNILPFDYDGDDFQDLVVVGGLYDAEVETPRADAGVGLVLRNMEGKGFEAIAPSFSGLYVTGNVRDAASILINGNRGSIFARNSDSPAFVLFKSKFSPSD